MTMRRLFATTGRPLACTPLLLLLMLAIGGSRSSRMIHCFVPPLSLSQSSRGYCSSKASAGATTTVAADGRRARRSAGFLAMSMTTEPPAATTTTTTTVTTNLKPGTAELDVPWDELGFQFRPTRSFLTMTHREGEGWGPPELVRGETTLPVHIGATALHYGQACFEGLKAFCHEDGQVYLFRPDENAARMQSSCRRIMMPELDTESFVDAIKAVVRDNLDYVPPYNSGGALYVRPLLFGSGPRIGLQPADEYTFVCMVLPVGDYYKGGLSKPVDALLIEDYDRAAPRGVGSVKVAGNYASDLLPNMKSRERGYPIGLYLDALTQTSIEEFSTSNFVGIKRESKKYVTPKTPSVLPSITNKSLMRLAADSVEEGWTVEERNVAVSELSDMDEVLAVGTAVVVTPVGSITRLQNSNNPERQIKYTFGEEGEIGPVTQRLYDQMVDIQNGRAPDTYGWNVKV